MHDPSPNEGVHNHTLTHMDRVSKHKTQKQKKNEYFYSFILMNLLYEDMNNRTQESIELHTNQIENPKISFDEYITNVKREMGEESEDPDPNPTLPGVKGRVG